jgi:CubicO group peptidase (beta-lactamase class C family)
VNSSSNSPSLQYLSVFVDTEVGSWYEKHGLTAGDYQRELGNASAQGFFPVCLQGAFSLTWEGGVPSGESPPPYPTPPSRPIPVSETYLSAIFAKSLVTVQKQFTATGPVANADIDNVIMQAMQNGGPQGGGPVRHASLAIVHGTQLVYARGYTWAEPDWPVVQPTTCFRLASVSKTPTALAIYKLIEDGMLNSDGSDKVQDILNLETPGGGSPTDPYFNDITIKNLLEHRNGLDQIPYSNGIPVQQAFQQAGKKVSLPVTADETDSYIASKTLNPDTSPPGTNQAYSNCGYYLLARVVAKLRNPLAWPLSRPIDAYQESLFNPLNITRIRRGRSLVVDQLPDEARYQDPDLPLGQSQMSDSEPLVPSQYGADYQKEIDEGAGGLSAAATDLARLVAILISQNNNPQPIIQRATIISMLTSGATLWTLVNNGTVKNVENPQNTRAGYGFDEVHASPYNPHNLGTLGSGQFYGQKGGEITAAQTVLQFDGDWGFVMLWAGKAPKPDWGVWYPDYQAVISIAQQVQWSQDLFSGYGMPPLL